MTELVHVQTEMQAEMQYAQAVVAQPDRGGAQSLLPAAYRGNPANVLIAIGLGKAIGISPAQALYEIYVVNGRPSPSANLMGALARRAGHKLRIKGDDTYCTATLIRADDPDEPYVATWTIEQARKITGLTGKDTWKSYPAAMLRARAISEVVRMGASESVIGMDYSAEEMRDITPQAAPVAPLTVADFVPSTVAPTDDVQDADVVPDEPAPTVEADLFEKPDVSARMRGKMFALFGKALDTDERTPEGKQVRLDYIARAIGRHIDSSNELTRDEVSVVIQMLESDADE